MIFLVLGVLYAVFFYLLVRGAARCQDRCLEERAEAEYFRSCERRNHEQKE